VNVINAILPYQREGYIDFGPGKPIVNFGLLYFGELKQLTHRRFIAGIIFPLRNWMLAGER
jgi:hypothetical protein